MPQLSAAGLCSRCAANAKAADGATTDDPDDSDGRAVLVCYGDEGGSVSMTDWESLDDALDAAIAFPSCRRDCIGVHDIATKVDGAIRTIHAAPAVLRRDISRAMTGDQDAIDRLRRSLNHEGIKHE